MDHMTKTIVGDCDFQSAGLSYEERYARANALCGNRDMGNGCTMADMFMGKHPGMAKTYVYSKDRKLVAVDNHDKTDCRGVNMYRRSVGVPQPYYKIWANLDAIVRLNLGLKDVKDENGELVDNPLSVAGGEALHFAGHSARTTGDDFGVLVCFAFAAGGMNALIAKVQTIDAISTGSRIWGLAEPYPGGDGHEYLAITRPGVATEYSTAKEEMFGDDDTIIVDYWRAQPQPLVPLAVLVEGPVGVGEHAGELQVRLRARHYTR